MINMENKIHQLYRSNNLVFQLSENRTELMGAAIIMIMCCHNTIVFPNPIVNHLWKNLSSFFQVGVDIFFLLSGIGCAFSLKKDYTYSRFLFRRLMRVMPTYLLVDGAYCVLQKVIWGTTFQETLFEQGLFSFYTAGILSEWFIAAIIPLYVISPLINKYIIKKKTKAVILGCILIYVLSIWISLSSAPDNVLRVNEIFIIRIPIFLFGMIAGNYIFDFDLKKKWNGTIPKTEDTLPYLGILFILILVFIIINKELNTSNPWTIIRGLFAPFSFVVSLILSNMLQKNNIIHRICRYLGGLTLELYLIHGKILMICDSFIQNKLGDSFVLLFGIQILSFALAVFISIVVKRIICIISVIAQENCKIAKL